MTDQRYTGPDGAKRLEMLEELAEGFADWLRASPGLFEHSHTRGIGKLSRDLTKDNGRVDRLEKKQPTSTRAALDFPLPRYTTRLK